MFLNNASPDGDDDVDSNSSPSHGKVCGRAQLSDQPGLSGNTGRDAQEGRGGFATSLTRMVSALIDTDETPKQADPTWGRLRQLGFYILHGTRSRSSHSSVFDIVIGIVVAFNMVTMIIETDAAAACLSAVSEGCIPAWIGVTNFVLLGIYAVELVLRLFVHRRSFFASRWNSLDLTTVICGLLGAVLADVDWFKRISILRLLRVARIIRVAAILNRFPVLVHFIGGFLGAMQAMLWGIMMILTMLVMWAMMAVEVIYPESLKLNLAEDDSCKDAFSSVSSSTLTFFQTLVAGDSLGRVLNPHHQTGASHLPPLRLCIGHGAARFHEPRARRDRRQGERRTRAREGAEAPAEDECRSFVLVELEGDDEEP